MPTVVTCPGCQANLKLPDGLKAKAVRCPKCKAAVPVTQEAVAVAAAPRPAPPASKPLPRDENDIWLYVSDPDLLARFESGELAGRGHTLATFGPDDDPFAAFEVDDGLRRDIEDELGKGEHVVWAGTSSGAYNRTVAVMGLGIGIVFFLAGAGIACAGLMLADPPVAARIGMILFGCVFALAGIAAAGYGGMTLLGGGTKPRSDARPKLEPAYLLTNRRLMVWTRGTPRSFTAPQLTRLAVSSHDDKSNTGNIVLEKIGDDDAVVGLMGVEKPHELESLIREVLIDKTFERLAEGRAVPASRSASGRGQPRELWSAAAQAVADRQEFDPASAKKRTRKELDAAGLDGGWQERIEDELTPSEAVLWAGRSSAQAMGAAAWVVSWMMIGGGTLAGSIIGGMALADFRLIGAGFLAIALTLLGGLFVWALLYPGYQRWLAGKTCYVVTTRKALVWYPSWNGTPGLTIYEPKELAGVHTVESYWCKGTGDVVFDKTVTVTVTRRKHGGTDRTTSVAHHGFLRIEEPRDIERLIRRELVDPMIEAAAE